MLQAELAICCYISLHVYICLCIYDILSATGRAGYLLLYKLICIYIYIYLLMYMYVYLYVYLLLYCSTQRTAHCAKSLNITICSKSIKRVSEYYLQVY